MARTTAQWLSLQDVARTLGFHEQTIRRWCRDGRGPRYFRFGLSYRFLREDVDAWLEERVAESRARQGLPPKIEDPQTVADLATLFQER